MWIAGAIVLAMVLYLIDKNQKWGTAWKMGKWVMLFALWLIAWAILDSYVPDRTTYWMCLVSFVGVSLLWEPFWRWMRNLP